MPTRSRLLVCLAGLVASCSAEEASGPSSGSSSGGSSTSSSSSSSGGTDGGSSTSSSSSSSSSGGGDGGGPKGPLYGFVGGTGKITVFDVDDATGAWTLKKETAISGSASFLAFDPARRRVVATNEDGGGQIRSFTFDPATGGLTPVNAQPAGGAGTTHVSLDPTGKWAFAANYTAGTMSVFPIDQAGTLGASKATRAPGGMAHWIGTDPAGTHLFCVSLGANIVAQYTLNTTTGQLGDNGTASPPANAGPRHLAFHPNEKWAFAINETAISLTPFDYDKATGKLTAKTTVSALPVNTNKNGVSGAEIVVHPSGKAVYASTRGYNSIARFTIGADGNVTLAENAMTGGNRPRSFGIDPEGTLLFAGNQDLNQVVGFKIDATTLALTPLGKAVDINGPTFVGLARIP